MAPVASFSQIYSQAPLGALCLNYSKKAGRFHVAPVAIGVKAVRKNVIFDFGGVLLDWDPRYLYRPYFNDDAKMEKFLAEICTGEWNSQMDAGKPFAEGVKELCAKYPEWTKEIELYHSGWSTMLHGALADGVELLKKIKADPRFTVYGLTNWSAETFPYAFNHYRFLDDFEGIVVSGEEMMKKPDKRIYYTLLERYHLKADECIFIDDSQANIDTANKIGIHGLLWRHNPDEVWAEIERLYHEASAE